MKKDRRRNLPFKWSPENVSATSIPNMVYRTYLEQQTVREILARELPIDSGTVPASIADVGGGYGRISLALSDYDVVLFEREPGLVEIGSALLPSVVVLQTAHLFDLPASDKSFDFVFTFTVLQHMKDEEAMAVIKEIKRISRRYILLVEETDDTYHRKMGRKHITHGRSREWYLKAILSDSTGWAPVWFKGRMNEPGYTYQGEPKPQSGHYMLFKRTSDDS